MAYSKLKDVDITSTGDFVYDAIDKLEDNIDQLVTDLNECHLTTQGDILYRSASQTTRLAAGTSGQFLTTGGSGANPSWSEGAMTTQGDIEYRSATARTRLAAGTAGQALTTGGASANPSWTGLTTQGDVEYHNGTNRTRLAAGTNMQFLQTQGASANPQWYNFIQWFPGFMTRAIFSYSDTDQIKLKPAVYEIGDKLVYWDSELTSETHGKTPGVDKTPVYYYLDDSEIGTALVTQINNTDFIWATTAPLWSGTKHGWYNGNDRCIFAVILNASNEIYNFYHYGDRLVKYDAEFTDRANTTALTASWVNVTLTVPAIDVVALVTFDHRYDSSAAYTYYRNDGSAGNGHIVSYVNTNGYWNTNTVPVETTASIIEVQGNATGTNLGVYTNGFYLPAGM